MIQLNIVPDGAALHRREAVKSKRSALNFAARR